MKKYGKSQGWFQPLRNIARQLGVRKKRGLASLTRGIVLGGLWQIYKRTIKLPVLITTYKNTNFLIRPNCITSSRFVYEGRPDELFVNALAGFSGTGVRFVDIGANVGLYTVLLCRTFERGWLFEPNPVAAEMARQNLALNSADLNFSVVHAAADSKPGKLEFPILKSPLPTAQVGQQAGHGTIVVDAIKLDEYLEANTDYVIKIDAEGMDLNVVTGLQNLFIKKRIRACLFECHEDSTLIGVRNIVSSLGYSLADEHGNPFENLTLDGRSRDLFVVRDDLLFDEGRGGRKCYDLMSHE